MGTESKQELVIGVSSQALFDLREEGAIFESLGPDDFLAYQRAQEETPFEPGTGFPLVKQLVEISATGGSDTNLSIVILSPNTGDSSLRIFRSLEFHDLAIQRVVLTSGESLARYLEPFQVDLFLSNNPEEIREANNEGVAAALVNEDSSQGGFDTDTIRIAFDPETVVFSDESDEAFENEGMERFVELEAQNAQQPTPQGPFAKLAKGISLLQQRGEPGRETVRTALISAGRTPSFERVVHAFRAWNLQLNEAFLLDGLSSKRVLEAFRPHIYFGSDLEDWVEIDEDSPIDFPETPAPGGPDSRAA